MRNQGTQFDKTTAYTYDARGNITSVTANGSTTTYVYDNLGQLTRENNQAAGKTWTWTYGTAGNILSKREYAYTTGTLGTALDTITYGYADSHGWGDLLTSYDGRSFQYDEIGNLLSDGEWTYTWAKGRQLVSMTKPGSTLTFTYDADGNRTSKTVNGVTTTYTYVDGRVTHETNGTDTIHYRYDTNGTLLSMNLNGTEYYYLYNGQRDVIGLYDASGKVVVEYTYDAWGRPLTTTGSLASTVGVKNPYRYRGYRYDAETGLYALQSRYYNPSIGKFICADSIFDGMNQPNGVNMLAYCRNRPVIMVDDTGCDAILLYEKPRKGAWGGHIGALIEDETGNWWYFYWGPDLSAPIKEQICGGREAETYCVEYSDSRDLESINNTYTDRNFTNAIYLEGDYTVSLESAKTANGNYSLLRKNCSQVTTGILSESSTRDQKVLATASKKVQPMTANRYVYWNRMPTKTSKSVKSVSTSARMRTKAIREVK